MVCDQVTVRTRKFGSDTAYQWQSSGADGYTVTECDKSDAGTEVIMHLKDDTEDEHYSEFLEEWKLRELIKKYSDYIRFPIRMCDKRKCRNTKSSRQRAAIHKSKGI